MDVRPSEHATPRVEEQGNSRFESPRPCRIVYQHFDPLSKVDLQLNITAKDGGIVPGTFPFSSESLLETDRSRYNDKNYLRISHSVSFLGR